jgi:uracil-DNA glycosylase
LTVAVGQAGSHSKLGWTDFTDAVIKALAATRGQNLVALLWGNHAQTLAPMLGAATVLRSVHPSPLSASRGFFGSKPFSSANHALQNLGLEPIDWSC